ncbi:MAG: phosphoribosylglycinamide formyltransferase [Pseudomonadales bacterium]
MINLAVLASHGGTTLQAVLDACASGQLPAQVSLVVSNNSGARALARARNSNAPTLHLSSATHPDPKARDAHMLNRLEEANADWLILAGYMKKLGGAVLSHYRGRIINTHPALLPKFGGAGFYGRKVHEAVLAAGESQSGATVHFVDGDYDTGPIIAQATVPVLTSDSAETLEERVKIAERSLLINTLQQLLSDTAHAPGNR